LKRVLAPIISNEEVMRGVYLLWAEAPAIASAARPGQFVMVKASDNCDPLLRRPLSVHRVRKDGAIALLIEVIGRGTEWLARRQAGEQLDLLGPLGNGFDIRARNLLLVAGGCGIAPLVFLAEKALSKERHLILLVGAKSGDRVYPRELLPADIATVTITEDGSVGERGMPTDLMSEYTNAHKQVFACGPADMYRAMAGLDWLKDKSVQVSLEARMGCGFGCCFGCTIETKRGQKRVCKDGPVFELGDLLF
jgi:dihydroorotate dehydrogenase electron transfer subunit